MTDNPKIQEMVALAEADVKRLRTATTSDAARKAWADFLEHSNRAINRLEGYSKRTNQIAKYKSLIKDEVWDSDLTKYVRIARNYHEHGVEDLDVDEPHHERVVFPNGQIIGSPTVIGMNAAGEEFLMPAAGPGEYELSPGSSVVRLKPTVQMVPVKDHQGNVVRPPHVAGLLDEEEPAIAAVARSYLAWVVSKIATFA